MRLRGVSKRGLLVVLAILGLVFSSFSTAVAAPPAGSFMLHGADGAYGLFETEVDECSYLYVEVKYVEIERLHAPIGGPPRPFAGVDVIFDFVDTCGGPGWQFSGSVEFVPYDPTDGAHMVTLESASLDGVEVTVVDADGNRVDLIVDARWDAYGTTVTETWREGRNTFAIRHRLATVEGTSIWITDSEVDYLKQGLLVDASDAVPGAPRLQRYQEVYIG